MARLLPLAIVAALAAPVSASPNSFGLALAMHGSQSGELSEGGMGPHVELARGRGRWQVFGEAGLAVIGVSHGGAGASIRAGAGARFLARTVDIQEARFDLLLEVAAGANHLQWADGHRTRPDLAAGVGWQVRTRKGSAPFAVRLTTRLVVTPTPAGEMPMEPRTNFGFLGLFGVAW